MTECVIEKTQPGIEYPFYIPNFTMLCKLNLKFTNKQILKKGDKVDSFKAMYIVLCTICAAFSNFRGFVLFELANFQKI